MLTKKIFVILFFVVIITPTVLLLVKTNPASGLENRRKAQWSDVKFSKSHPFAFILQFENYFNDNFGGRDILNECYVKYKMDLLHTDPFPKKVIQGKNEWLFLGNSYVNTYDESLGLNTNMPQDIDAIARNIAGMKLFCDTNNVKFYFCVAPNKNSFYQEFLPVEGMKLPRRIDLVREKLRDTYKIDMIDLRDSLLPYKNSTTLFYKTDTHWNEYGAFLATKQLINVMHKDFATVPEKSIENYEVDSSLELSHKDLVGMIGIKRNDLMYRFTPKHTISTQLDSIGVIDGNKCFASKTQTNNVKVVVYRDSYFTSMFNFFIPQFGSSTLYWTKNFDKNVVKQAKPDAVVFEIVERNLIWLR